MKWKKIRTYFGPFRVMPFRFAVRNIFQGAFFNGNWLRWIFHAIWIQTQAIANNLIVFNTQHRTGAHQIETIAKTFTPRPDEPIANIASHGFSAWLCSVWCWSNVTAITFWYRTITKYRTILCSFAALGWTLNGFIEKKNCGKNQLNLSVDCIWSMNDYFVDLTCSFQSEASQMPGFLPSNTCAFLPMVEFPIKVIGEEWWWRWWLWWFLSLPLFEFRWKVACCFGQLHSCRLSGCLSKQAPPFTLITTPALNSCTHFISRVW